MISGRPKLYNEKTITVGFKVPISQVPYVKNLVMRELLKMQKPITNLKRIKER